MDVPVWQGIGKITWYICGGICWLGAIICGWMLVNVIIAYIKRY